MNNSINISILTFDQDWAPDFICEDIAQKLIEYNVKSTWFITHKSNFLNTLRSNPDLFELGIHPNFLPGSTHGKDYKSVLSHICAIVPEARCSRSHSVVQSGAILHMLRNEFQINCDLTLFLYEQSGIQTVELFTDRNKKLTRLPVFWCDDHEFNNPWRNWSIRKYTEIPGIKVFSFHPIHVYLNSDGTTNYNKVKDIQNQNSVNIKPLQNHGSGARNAFNELCEILKGSKNYFISQLYDVSN